jgi:hypothetical protein
MVQKNAAGKRLFATMPLRWALYLGPWFDLVESRNDVNQTPVVMMQCFQFS